MKTPAVHAEFSWFARPFFDTVSSPNPVVRSDRQPVASNHAVGTAHKARSSVRALAVRRRQGNRAGHLHCPKCAHRQAGA
jgi:hypothetical protein